MFKLNFVINEISKNVLVDVFSFFLCLHPKFIVERIIQCLFAHPFSDRKFCVVVSKTNAGTIYT